MDNGDCKDLIHPPTFLHDELNMIKARSSEMLIPQLKTGSYGNTLGLMPYF